MEGMVVSSGFWTQKKVLITGHTGFKGAWLSLWLCQLGARVTGVSLPPPTVPSLFEVARVADCTRSIFGDVRNLSALERIVSKTRPEIIFHMSAQSLVRRAYNDPVETYAINVMGTVNLLEAVRRIGGVRAVVVITSDKCYENLERIRGCRESDAMGGHDPYSSSKGSAELVVSAYRRSFFSPERYREHGIGLASARAGNAIGGGDWAKDRLIPDLLLALETGKVVNIRNPDAVRPWQHVLEPLRGYLILAERLFENGPDYAEGWNFGPTADDVKAVKWIVERMVSMWREGAKWQVDDLAHPHEAAILRLDIAKAKQRLNWYPLWYLDTALKKIIDWHSAWKNQQDMQEFCLAQINEYLGRD